MIEDSFCKHKLEFNLHYQFCLFRPTRLLLLEATKTASGAIYSFFNLQVGQNYKTQLSLIHFFKIKINPDKEEKLGFFSVTNLLGWKRHKLKSLQQRICFTIFGKWATEKQKLKRGGGNRKTRNLTERAIGLVFLLIPKDTKS